MRSVRNRVDGEEPVDRLVQIRGSLARIVRVAVGHEHYLASGAAGELYSWGGGASVLGHGPDLEAFNKCPALHDIKGVEGATIATPRLVERLVGTIIVDVSAGGDTSSFALSARGEAFSWGYGWEGRLGHGGPILLPGDSDLPYQWYFPTKIAALALQRIVRVSGGYDHALFLSERGEVFSCGCAGVAARTMATILFAASSATATRIRTFTHRSALRRFMESRLLKSGLVATPASCVRVTADTTRLVGIPADSSASQTAKTGFFRPFSSRPELKKNSGKVRFRQWRATIEDEVRTSKRERGAQGGCSFFFF